MFPVPSLAPVFASVAKMPHPPTRPLGPEVIGRPWQSSLGFFGSPLGWVADRFLCCWNQFLKNRGVRPFPLAANFLGPTYDAVEQRNFSRRVVRRWLMGTFWRDS